MIYVHFYKLNMFSNTSLKAFKYKMHYKSIFNALIMPCNAPYKSGYKIIMHYNTILLFSLLESTMQTFKYYNAF